MTYGPSPAEPLGAQSKRSKQVLSPTRAKPSDAHWAESQRSGCTRRNGRLFEWEAFEWEARATRGRVRRETRRQQGFEGDNRLFHLTPFASFTHEPVHTFRVDTPGNRLPRTRSRKLALKNSLMPRSWRSRRRGGAGSRAGCPRRIFPGRRSRSCRRPWLRRPSRRRERW